LGYNQLGALPDTPDVLEVKCITGMFNMNIFKGYVYYDY
jgi:hypothetical protein